MAKVNKKTPAWTRKEGKSPSGGLNKKGRDSYKRENPGSKLKAPVTGKVKKGSKAAKRRKSFCARMSGMKGPMKDSKCFTLLHEFYHHIHMFFSMMLFMFL